MTNNEVDYGYGDAAPDYGYGDASPDYGYGDAAPEYGYGDAAPDYGYGDSAPDQGYGYGDAQPDYGYGDEPAQAAPPKDRRPKRRCSVTKYSLVSQPTAETDKDVQPGVNAEEAAAVDYGYGDDKSAAVTEATYGSQSDDGSMPAHKDEHHKKGLMGKGLKKMNNIRKRLSIAF